MTEALTQNSAPADPAALLERVLIQGDLAQLTPPERLDYYRRVCESLGLNPLTKPFEYLTLSGRLTLYARKDCTDQLRKLHGVSIAAIQPQMLEVDLYVVVARATDRTGRTDTATGVIMLTGLRGEARANAMMKCETKAKRRVTLSLCGLGMLDETEVETIPAAELQVVAPSAPIDTEHERHRAEIEGVPFEEWRESLAELIDTPKAFDAFWHYLVQPVNWARLSNPQRVELLAAKNAGKKRLGIK